MTDKFSISPIELACLRKLEIVSQALASRLSGSAGREQKCLADTLHDVLTRYLNHDPKGTWS